MSPSKPASLTQQRWLLTLTLCISSLSIFLGQSTAAAAAGGGAGGATVKTIRRKAGQRCDYTLVVHEFDPSLCPAVVSKATGGGPPIVHQGTLIGSSPSVRSALQAPSAGNGTTVRPPTGPEAIIGYFNDGSAKPQLRRNGETASSSSSSTTQEVPSTSSSSSSTVSELLQKIELLESKIQSVTLTSNQLKTTRDLDSARIDQIESQLRDMERNCSEALDRVDDGLRSVDLNLTRIEEDMADVVLQKTYWKSVDVKLGGLMLDMTETNQAIARHDRQLEKLGVNEKVIPVQTTSELVGGCSIAPEATKYRDCEELHESGQTKSGVYYVTPLYASCPIPVYCDMDTPPGGWMVIQRRQDGQTDFNRNWTDYRAGFGGVGHEFWLGLDNIFLLSSQKHYELRVDLWDFFGSRVHATYGRFHVEGEREGYRLHVANHSGSVADGMQHHNGVLFSTPDRDQDTYPEYHCAKEWTAGWWFANCWFVILNGQYYNHTQVEYRGLSWNEWKNEQLMKTEMKIRPSSMSLV